MNIHTEVNFEELARCTDDFNGAQLKAVCVEAGMIALRRGASELAHEDYMDGTCVSNTTCICCVNCLCVIGISDSLFVCCDCLFVVIVCLLFVCRYTGSPSKEENKPRLLCMRTVLALRNDS